MSKSAQEIAIEDDEKRKKRIKFLADAVSSQAQIANKLWLSMTTVAMFAVLARKQAGTSEIKLPFSLGSVEEKCFYPIAYALLIILMISFSSSYVQQVTAQTRAQRALDIIEKEPGAERLRPIRFWFDVWRKPNLNRVGSLPLSIGVKRESRHWWNTVIKIVRILYYLILKFIAALVYFFLPLASLWRTFLYLDLPSWLGDLCFAFGLIASIALAHALTAEISYIRSVVESLGNNSSS
jgi:hypothetical protein